MTSDLSGVSGSPATSNQVTMTVILPVTPTFTSVAPICSGDVLSPLPPTSNEGIPGTWSPALDNTATTTYTFTPVLGECATPTTLTINVNNPLTASVSITADRTTVTTGTTVNFTATPVNGGTTPTYQWMVNGINAGTNSAAWSYIPADGDVVSLRMASSLGCVSGSPATSNQIPITVTAGLVASVTIAADRNNVCAGTTVTFTAIPVNGGTTPSYQWMVNGTNTGTNSDTYSYIPSNGDVVEVVMTSDLSGVSGSPATSNQQTINLQPIPAAPTATVITQPTCAVPTGTIVIGAPLGANLQYSRNGTTWQSSNTFSGLTADAGYTISVRNSTSPNCVSSANFIINAIPSAPAAPLGTILQPTCSVSTGTIQITSPLGGNLQYSSNGTTWQNSTTFAGLTANTTYSISIRSSINPTCLSSANFAINAAPVVPAIPIIGTLTQPTCSTATGSVIISGLPGTGAWTLTRNPGGITINGTGTSRTVTGLASGTFNFTVSNAVGCTSSPTANITINAAPDTPSAPIVGNIIQPTCDTPTGTVSLSGLPATGIWTLSRNPGATLTGAGINTTIGGLSPGTYQFTVTNSLGCTSSASNPVVINTITPITPLFNPIEPLCQNSVPPGLPTLSTNGISGAWNPAVISTQITGTQTYNFTPLPGQCASNATLPITINSPVLPLFDPIGSLCQYGTPPVLPTTSTNGITGIWFPDIINTDQVGMSTYTFTPATSECAKPLSITITINAPITPTFSGIAPICRNSIPPPLPTSSTNGIKGTWSPAVINVTIPKTNTYKFTPATDQCANTLPIQVTVYDRITPTFEVIGPVCQNTIPPALPIHSIEGITVKWDPPTINTAKIGTTGYLFTPMEGCAWTDAISVIVTPKVTPDFAPIGPLCQYSLPPILSATSLNGITGNWSPAEISTDKDGLYIFTFTPLDQECYNTISKEVIVNSSLITAFDPIGPLCQFDVPPALPLTSVNGIAGTWEPSAVNTANAGTFNFTFTPDSQGPCASQFKTVIIVRPKQKPIFDAIGPLCLNSKAPQLPAISANGIKGTWEPANINTENSGSTTYTFTPDGTECAFTQTLAIVVITPAIPTFDPVGPLCQNTTAPVLPLNSNNGVTGSWSPTTINTENYGTFSFTFNPASDQCAIPVPQEISINPTTTSSTEQTICTSQLPYIWNNINISSAGTYNAKLIGSLGCDSIATLNLQVTNELLPAFDQIGPLLYGSDAPVLPITSANHITGTWNPSIIATDVTGTISYRFTPDPNQCAATTKMDIQVDIQAVISEGGIVPDPNGIQIGSCEVVKLDGSKSVGDNLQYQWSTTDQGCILTQSTGMTTEFSLSGEYKGSLPADFSVKLQVTDKFGNSKSDLVTIHIDPPPNAEVYSSGEIEKDGSMIVDGTVSTGIAISYKWSTSEGKIIGPADHSTAAFFGAGMYQLTIVDIHGCQSIKDFKFPLEVYRITARPDNYRITWSQDTILNVKDNDYSNSVFSTVRVIRLPSNGTVTVNSDLSITYTPTIRKPGNDQFEYEICNPVSLCDSALVTLEIFDSSLYLPEGFSPNGDGVNDYLKFDGLQNYKSSKLYIYTRSGQLVYSSGDYQNNWDGRIGSGLNRQLVATGTYYYVLKLGETNRTIKGFIYIGY